MVVHTGIVGMTVNRLKQTLKYTWPSFEPQQYAYDIPGNIKIMALVKLSYVIMVYMVYMVYIV